MRTSNSRGNIIAPVTMGTLYTYVYAHVIGAVLATGAKSYRSWRDSANDDMGGKPIADWSVYLPFFILSTIKTDHERKILPFSRLVHGSLPYAETTTPSARGENE